MDIFDLDQALIERYESFARSFSEIRAPEIRAQVDAAYNEQRFWPEPVDFHRELTRGFYREVTRFVSHSANWE